MSRRPHAIPRRFASPTRAFCSLVPMAAAVLAACGDQNVSVAEQQIAANTRVEKLSSEFMSEIGDVIGEARNEARYFARRYVVSIDRLSPHLHLFTIDGKPLWSGAPSGGGPKELNKPVSLAVLGDTVFVFQRGRISRWRLDSDSLAFVEAVPLPVEYVPMGAVPGCDGGLLLYARNDRQLGVGAVTPDTTVNRIFGSLKSSGATGSRTGDRHVDHLYSLSIERGNVVLQPWWGLDGETLTPGTMHGPPLISRYDTLIALQHRSNVWQAGTILQINCKRAVVNSYSELALATGNGFSVQIKAPRVLEWTAGIVALPDGILFAEQRYFNPKVYAGKEPQWKTEFFLLKGGASAGSIVVDRQWTLLDYDPEFGVLMGTYDPAPHFIRVPAKSITSGD